MKLRLKVTQEAKRKAKSSLLLLKMLPKSQQFGLSKSEARQLGINSGIERAKQIIRSKYLYDADVISVCRFKRFLNQTRSLKVQGAINLWGGENFIRKACKVVSKR
jgi:hypothetical protein